MPRASHFLSRPGWALLRRGCSATAAGLLVVALVAPAAVAVPAAVADVAAPKPAPPTQAVGAPPRLPATATVGPSIPQSTPLHLTIVLQPRDPAGLAALAKAVSTPGSPEYRRYLSAGEFARRFGPTQTTIASVRSELSRLGLAWGPVSGNGLSISVTTTAALATAKLGASLSTVRLADGRHAFANTSAPRLSATVAPAVAAILGLDDLAAATPQVLVPSPVKGGTQQPSTKPAAATASAGSTGPQPCSSASTGAAAEGAYTESQLAQAYSFGALYGAGLLGAGQTVALVELAGYNHADIAAFQACYNNAAQVTDVSVDGGATDSSGVGQLEAELDIEDVIGLAPQAIIAPYMAANSWSNLYDVYNRIVSDDTAQVISVSWGQCESGEPSGFAQEENILFEQAATQGQSILVASGDYGSEDCAGTATLAVQDPASNPLVTGVGGTTLAATGASGGANNTPPSETVWTHDGYGSGGGLSSTWTMPAAQQGIGVENQFSSATPCAAPTGSFCRQVPDVAASADPSKGYSVYYTGNVTTATGWVAVGGTSAAAPLWGALTALANQGCSCRLGDLNPGLYDVAAQGPGAFNDIIVGSNDAQQAHGGDYPATAGYDLATGLGSPVAGVLAARLATQFAAAASGNEAPTWAADTPPSQIGAGAQFGFRFRAFGSPAPVFSLASGSLPDGLTLDPASGLVSGTATTTGPFTFTVEADNGVGTSAITPSITTLVMLVAPAFTSAGTFTLPAGQSGSFTVATTGQPTASLTETGVLPAGVTFADNSDGTATLSGTAPSRGSVSHLMLAATNGTTIYQSFTLVISSPPLFVAAAPPSGLAGLPYGYEFKTSGTPAPVFSVTSGRLPPGLVLDPERGDLWGRPTTVGTSTFSVSASNGVGPPITTASLSVTITTPAVGTLFAVAGSGGGKGTDPYAGDGGPALTAPLQIADGVAVDNFGNLYVSDWLNNRVRKITPGGVITDFAGSPTGEVGNSGDGGPATAALLNGPTALAVDSTGNVYIADAFNQRVRKVTPDGTITNFAGDPAGHFNNSGDDGPATSAYLFGPDALAIDQAGDVFIADSGNNRVRKVTPDGTITNFAGSPDGTAGNGGNGGPATAAHLNLPYGLAVNGQGTVYIADRWNNQVRKVDPTGIISTIAGSPAGSNGNAGDGGSATAATLNTPIDVALDAAGNLYVDDAANSRIREITTDGIIHNVAGSPDATPRWTGLGGPATAALLQYPSRVAVGANGFVYIANQDQILAVDQPPLPPAVISPPAATFTVGVAGSFNVTTAVPHQPGLTLTENGALPAGVAFNPANGVLSGTPGQAAAGIYPLTLTATGPGGPSTQSFALTIDQARFTYPVDGQTSVDTTLPFTWSTIPEAQGYIVTAGSQAYAADLANSGVLPAAATRYPIPNVAMGKRVFASLLAEVRGTWTSYEAIAFTAGPGQATLLFPTNGQTGVDPTKAFSWSTVGGAQKYLLVVGTQVNGADVANSGLLPATASGYAGPILPAGRTLYATLLTEVNGAWTRYQSITFTTGPAQALFTRPVNGQQNLPSATTLAWTTLARAQGYLVTVGTAPLGTNVVNSAILSPTVGSRAVTLPAHRLLYATLYTEVANRWVYQQVAFTAGA